MNNLKLKRSIIGCLLMALTVSIAFGENLRSNFYLNFGPMIASGTDSSGIGLSAGMNVDLCLNKALMITPEFNINSSSLLSGAITLNFKGDGVFFGVGYGVLLTKFAKFNIGFSNRKFRFCIFSHIFLESFDQVTIIGINLGFGI